MALKRANTFMFKIIKETQLNMIEECIDYLNREREITYKVPKGNSRLEQYT